MTSNKSVSLRKRSRIRKAHLNWTRHVQLVRNTGLSTGREPQDSGATIVVVRVKLTLEWVRQSSHQGERESRSQGEGLQVGESHGICEASVMLSAQKYIEIVRNRGQRQLPLNRVYRLIRHQELFLAAYGKLYANKGALTPGVNPLDTVDGMSLKRIEAIQAQLATGTYQWTPVKREYIDKKNGRKRPLGLPGWQDKLLQEVIRMVLEAYYEPQFSQYSHGFRPGRGCHTALESIRRHWKGVTWIIEGDIQNSLVPRVVAQPV